MVESSLPCSGPTGPFGQPMWQVNLGAESVMRLSTWASKEHYALTASFWYLFILLKQYLAWLSFFLYSHLCWGSVICAFLGPHGADQEEFLSWGVVQTWASVNRIRISLDDRSGFSLVLCLFQGSRDFLGRNRQKSYFKSFNSSWALIIHSLLCFAMNTCQKKGKDFFLLNPKCINLWSDWSGQSLSVR